MATVMGDHAATGFGDFAIGVAEYWPALEPQDGDEEQTRQARRRHQGRGQLLKKDYKF